MALSPQRGLEGAALPTGGPRSSEGRGGKTHFKDQTAGEPPVDLKGWIAGIHANRARRLLFAKGDGMLQLAKIAGVIDLSSAGMDYIDC